MPSSNSETEQFVSSLQRAILGVALAIIAILGFGWAQQLESGELLWGSIGVLLLLGAGAWLLFLLQEGLEER